MKRTKLRLAYLVAVFGFLCGAANGQILSEQEKASVRSKPGEIFVAIEPNVPFRLLYEGGVCLQIEQKTGTRLWIETTHPKFSSLQSKPPPGWVFKPCDDKAGAK